MEGANNNALLNREKYKRDLVDSLVLLYLCSCCYCRREFINSSYLEVSENNTMTELELHNSNLPSFVELSLSVAVAM